MPTLMDVKIAVVLSLPHANTFTRRQSSTLAVDMVYRPWRMAQSLFQSLPLNCFSPS